MSELFDADGMGSGANPPELGDVPAGAMDDERPAFGLSPPEAIAGEVVLRQRDKLRKREPARRDSARSVRDARTVRSDVLQVFYRLGGVKAMAEWARKNPDVFYTVILPRFAQDQVSGRAPEGSDRVGPARYLIERHG